MKMPAGPFGLLVCKAPPWARKNFYLRTPPPWYRNRAGLSAPQLSACLALARAANAAYGKRGKVMYKGVNMPIVAVEVAKAVPKGAKVHGGLTRAERAERRHSMASASIAGLEGLLSQKRGVAAAAPT